jgi:hypothetical protein
VELDMENESEEAEEQLPIVGESAPSSRLVALPVEADPQVARLPHELGSEVLHL